MLPLLQHVLVRVGISLQQLTVSVWTPDQTNHANLTTDDHLNILYKLVGK